MGQPIYFSTQGCVNIIKTTLQTTTSRYLFLSHFLWCRLDEYRFICYKRYGLGWNGKLDIGIYQFLRKCSIFAVELWGILNGLILLQKEGHDRVFIQSDNLEVIKAICDRQLVGASISLVRRIQQILFHEDKWFVRYIFREENQTTNALAKMVFVNVEYLCLFNAPPIEIQIILETDRVRDN